MMDWLITGCIALIVSVLFWSIWGIANPARVLCEFDRVPGQYEVLERDIRRESSHIVAYRDDRTFAFKREQLKQCEDLK